MKNLPHSNGAEADSVPNRPLRLLCMLDELDIGGTEQQILELVRRIDRDRFEPMVCCFRHGRHSFVSELADGRDLERRDLVAPAAKDFEPEAVKGKGLADFRNALGFMNDEAGDGHRRHGAGQDERRDDRRLM